MQAALERLLFATRWLLVPLYLALGVAVLALIAKAGQRVYELAIAFPASSESSVMLGALGIVDLTLTASLVVIVIFSGYVNFVARIDASLHHDWPQWMAGIDFSELKLKLMGSIVAISGINLLEAFTEIAHESDRDLYWRAGIHLVFVISALSLGLADWLSHRAETPDH
jgi:uncharacterized protein (TIGR00645 family)